MATGVELLLLAFVVAALFGVHRVIRAVKPLAVNAGLLVLLIANAVGFGVAVTPIVVLIVAFAGLPGALLVILLARLGLLFSPLAAIPLAA